MERIITGKEIQDFYNELLREEKSAATIEKYIRDVKKFCCFASGKPVTKELVLAYKRHTMEKYAVRSVNSMLASLNCFFRHIGWAEFQVKCLRIQQQTFQAEEHELSKGEYLRLLEGCRQDERMKCILETLCATGIRVSELRFFTVEDVRRGVICVQCKNKTRNVFIPGKLKKILLNYARSRKIAAGILFRTKGGRPMDRSNIWTMMKRLCAKVGVSKAKVFPHNLRKLFARTFYAMEKDIAKLADLLGHSSISTTRIYIMTTGEEHRRKIERLGLVI